MENNYFSELNSVNVNDKTEKKNGLTYLAWAYAWGEVKKRYPNATYKIYENKDEWNYFTDGRTCWVKTSVTVEGVEHIETLAVMNNRNTAIPFDSVTSTDIGKSIQRCLTKACARHGLGLYVYAGEDLPDQEQEDKPLTRKEIVQQYLTENDCNSSVVRAFMTDKGAKAFDDLTASVFQELLTLIIEAGGQNES